jgi:hypothetical protein
MKKRKAKRINPAKAIHIDHEIAKAIEENKKQRELALLNLIAEIIVNATLRDLHGDNKR